MDELTRQALTDARQGEALRRLMLARDLTDLTQVAAHLGLPLSDFTRHLQNGTLPLHQAA